MFVKSNSEKKLGLYFLCLLIFMLFYRSVSLGHTGNESFEQHWPARPESSGPACLPGGPLTSSFVLQPHWPPHVHSPSTWRFTDAVPSAWNASSLPVFPTNLIPAYSSGLSSLISFPKNSSLFLFPSRLASYMLSLHLVLLYNTKSSSNN